MVSTIFSYTESLSEKPKLSFRKKPLSDPTDIFKQGKGQQIDHVDLENDALNVRSLMMFGPHNKTMRLTNTPLTDQFVDKISRECERLIELRIIGTTEKVSPRAYCQLVQLKNLKVLEYENMNADSRFLKMVSKLPHLEELNIANNNGIASSDLSDMGKMPDLKKLVVGWKKNSGKPWKMKDLVQFLNSRNEIKVLVFKESILKNLDDWKKVLNLAYIKELDLSGCDGVDLQVVNRLVKVPQLKKLYLVSSRFKISDIEYLQTKYPELEIIVDQRGVG